LYQITEVQVDAICRWARKRPRIVAVHLFGSRAKGCARPDSDVDLALTLSEDASETIGTIWMYRLKRWRGDLWRSIKLKPDLRVMNLGNDNIRRWCEEHGVLLYRAGEKVPGGIWGQPMTLSKEL